MRILYFLFYMTLTTQVFGECNDNKYKTLPDIRSVLGLCVDEKYRQAHDLLMTVWDDWSINNRLSDDQTISLHFLNAYLHEKLGMVLEAENDLSKVYQLQISQDYKNNQH